ncbi:ANTAR domain-containing protein [Amycolatopsis sp. NPDC051106]|uniref:ANTAR domain-containing response regulator n=1 Tax=unclassified Amycolatopsis TaxID=2618356 RepID=UPI0034198D8A
MSHGRELVDERDAARRVDEVTSALEQLTAALDEDERLPVILQRVCRQVAHAVPDTELASITLLREGAPYTVAATGDGAALRSARRYTAAQETIEQLRTALSSRAVIDQAKGILMALHRISADDAFGRLVEQSQNTNLKLRDVAEQFVTDVLDNPG